MSRPPTTLVDDLATIRAWSQNRSSVTPAEIDDIEFLIGDGSAVITTGIKGALRLDFNAVITGSYLQEYTGTSGSIVLLITKAQAGAAPVFASINASAPPTITSGRYAADETLTGWTTTINRGDVLRFAVTSVSTFTAILYTLRIRRLEP